MPPEVTTRQNTATSSRGRAGISPARVPRRATSSGVFLEKGKPQRGSVDFVVSEVVRGLYEGRFAPGQKLLESDLTQRFGVGRGSLREALRRLESEGLVSVVLNRGARIRMFTRRGARDFFELIEKVTGMAARLAAERIRKPADAAVLGDASDQLAEAIEAANYYAIARGRYQYLSCLVALSDNMELGRLLPRYDGTVIRTQFRSVYDLKREREDLVSYRRVAELVAAKDGPGAERVIRKQVHRAASAVQRLPDDQFAD